MSEQLAIQNQLRDYFLEAQRKNSSFSLRAYAKKLQISPSALSEILNGKRRVSMALAQKLLIQIGKDPKEQHRILNQFTNGSSGPDSEDILTLSADQFHIVSDWYHFAILSLAETKGFQADAKWIAGRLGISLVQSEAAMERLERLQMVKWDRKKKKATLTGKEFRSPDDVALQAIRQSHLQDLELAEQAILQVPIERRDFTSMTMAIDAKKLPQAKKLIREFQDKISGLLETGSKDEVYKLCIHLLPLSVVDESLGFE